MPPGPEPGAWCSPTWCRGTTAERSLAEAAPAYAGKIALAASGQVADLG